PASLPPTRHPFLHGGSTQDLRPPHADQARPFGILGHAALHGQLAHLVRGSSLPHRCRLGHSPLSFTRSMMLLVERPGTSGTTSTLPPAAITSAAPTISSGR